MGKGKLFIIAALLAAVLCACSGDTEGQGTVHRFTGQVTIDGASAKVGQAVPPGAEVATGKDSFVEIMVADRSVVRFFENSRARFQTDPQNRVSLLLGAMASFITDNNPVGKSRYTNFSVDTPTMVAGVRGTAFYIEVLSPDETYFCTCNGKMSASDAHGDQPRLVEAAHHKASLYTRKDGGIVATPAEMAHHTDEQMEDLAAQVGAKIDWTTSEK